MPEIKSLVKYINKYKNVFAINDTLFNIFEGDIVSYVLEDLRKQLSPASYEQARHRVPSINILVKLVDKLSSIYIDPPTRVIENGNESDQELLDWYVSTLDLNSKMLSANEFYNLFKNTLLSPYTNDGLPCLRVIPSMSFLPYGDNYKDPTIVTAVIIYAGKDDKGTEVYAYFSDNEFFMFDMKEKKRTDLMRGLDNEDGLNPVQKIPNVYINSSDNLLIPKPDNDLLVMSKLVNVLLADLNLISMFTSFPIRYGIDVDDKNLAYAPNAYWSFTSQGDGEKKPQVGTLDAKADLDGLMNVINAELSLWLSTRGLKPSAMSGVDIDSAVAGISKMIDEIDTTDHRKKQVIEFTKAENKLWDLIINYLHPYWVSTGEIEVKALFSVGAKVSTTFVEQVPSLKRGEVVSDLKSEVDNGFLSRKRAIRKLNPDMTEDEIDLLLEEINDESTIIQGE